MRPSSASVHIFPGCCLTSSTARIESASGVARSWSSPRTHHVRPAERIRRAHDREEVVALARAARASTRSTRCRETWRSRTRLGAGTGRRRRTSGRRRRSPRVRRDDDTLEDAALPRRLDRVGEERVPGERSDVLAGHALGSRARAPINATAPACEPPRRPRSARSTGTRDTEPAAAARTTDAGDRVELGSAARRRHRAPPRSSARRASSR